MLKTTKCPNCGGKLQVSETRQSFICSYCGVEFFFEKNHRSSNIAESPKPEPKQEEELKDVGLKITFPGGDGY